jgi:hypothetical protein
MSDRVQLRSNLWSASSLHAGVDAMDNSALIKRELPDDPEDLKMLIEVRCCKTLSNQT